MYPRGTKGVPRGFQSKSVASERQTVAYKLTIRHTEIESNLLHCDLNDKTITKKYFSEELSNEIGRDSMSGFQILNLLSVKERCL